MTRASVLLTGAFFFTQAVSSGQFGIVRAGALFLLRFETRMLVVQVLEVVGRSFALVVLLFSSTFLSCAGSPRHMPHQHQGP